MAFFYRKDEAEIIVAIPMIINIIIAIIISPGIAGTGGGP